MFCIKNPSELNRPWILSRNCEDNVTSIPLEVTKCLFNYHIMGIEFLYHNYRKGMKGSILNQELDMNFPLQLAGFLRALARGPALVLVVCPRESARFWHYHLSSHADFKVIHITDKTAKDSYKTTKKLAVLVYTDCLQLCEDLVDYDYLSVIIEDLDQLATKRVVKKLCGTFNVGLTTRSFYTHPDQKLQWHMLNWANPGCVGKLNEFYDIDNQNFESFNDNYRHWWLRLTWRFCESFVPPTKNELQSYQKKVTTWASNNSVPVPKPVAKRNKQRKRKLTDESSLNKVKMEESPPPEVVSDSCSSPEAENDYVELPSMDESPIVTSIIRNFEIAPEPIVAHSKLPYTQSQSCSSFKAENQVILSFLSDDEKPSTSRSESEDFILNLI